MKYQATWAGVVIAESDRCVIVGGVHYFPSTDVLPKLLRPVDHRTVCPWKGKASYFDLDVDGNCLSRAAWCYPNPKSGYEHIAGAIAFSQDVDVAPEESGQPSGEETIDQPVLGVEAAFAAAGAAARAGVHADRDSNGNSASSEPNEDILRFLQELPKTEVHVHLEAMIDVDRLWQLISRHPERRILSSREELLGRFQVRSLQDFISLFIDVIQPVISSAEDLGLFVESAADYMRRNTIEYAEVFVAPTKLLERGIEFEHIVRVLDEGAGRLRREFGLDMRFLVDVSRGFGLENAMRNLELTIANPCESVIGIGLGGAEQASEAATFAPVFERAREADLHTTAHAGEIVDSHSIRQAVDVCGAERIGHGLSAMHDPELMQELGDRKIPVELCPASNVFTGAYIHSIAEYPLRLFFDRGIPVSLNTDDPVIFGVELIDEFMSAHEYHGFTRDELLALNDNSINMSFMPEQSKQEMKVRCRNRVGL